MITTDPTTAPLVPPTTTRAYLDARRSDWGCYLISRTSCPRALVGGRHRRHSPRCWCVSQLNDHGGTYMLDGVRMVLWSPYGVGCSHELLRLSLDAEDDGLWMRIADEPDERGFVHLAFEVDNRVYDPAGSLAVLR